MNLLLLALISALVITIIIEYPILILFIRKDKGVILFYTILINGLTNPLLNYFIIFAGYNILFLEAGVVMIETILIALLTRTGMRRSLYCSLCANGTSYLTGKILVFLTLT